MTLAISLARDALRFNVIFIRAQQRISQVDLAKKAGVSRAVVSAIENGECNVTLDVLEKLAKALQTSAAELLAEHAQGGNTDEDISRRDNDGPEAYVDARSFIAALGERPGRYSQRGRRKTVSR